MLLTLFFGSTDQAPKLIKHLSNITGINGANALFWFLKKMNEIHELITRRWSPVAFDRRPLEEEQIRLLFKAAGWAPSARNAQPWRFIYATADIPEYKILLGLCDDANQVWARTAPLLVLGLAQVISTYKDYPNRLAFYETGMAVSNLLLQATAMGLYVHQMSGYDEKRAPQVLAIPPRYEPAAMMAIGYKGDRSQLPDSVAAREDRERTRKEVSEILFGGRYLEP
jgi:nitroreductase